MITATPAEAREIELLLHLTTMKPEDITALRALLGNSNQYSALGIIRWLRDR